MRRAYITGPSGLIARNLCATLTSRGHEVITDEELFAGVDYSKLLKTGEACVHRNAEILWRDVFLRSKIDLVVHNAALVGTDVVALNAHESTLTNVQGTYNIVRAANAAGAAVCYLGTTVIYDTFAYQDTVIVEDSVKIPRTYYGIQKLAGEQIVSTMANRWTVVRPLFAYGGLGDMNSLIAKSIYASLKDRTVDMFLDPAKVKDYLHVSDFCAAVEEVCRDPDGPGWGTDWNVAAETPVSARGVVEEIESLLPGTAARIKWHPQVDYLGHHRLSSRKIREKIGWKPQLDLSNGIRQTLEWIRGAEGYNPLSYLDEAQHRGVDLLQHFPKM